MKKSVLKNKMKMKKIFRNIKMKQKKIKYVILILKVAESYERDVVTMEDYNRDIFCKIHYS